MKEMIAIMAVLRFFFQTQSCHGWTPSSIARSQAIGRQRRRLTSAISRTLHNHAHADKCTSPLTASKSRSRSMSMGTMDSMEDEVLLLEDFDAETTLTETATSTIGIPDSFVIVDQYLLSHDAFDLSDLSSLDDTASTIERLQLTPTNISLPVALMMVDPTAYPSFSKARKACRKGNVLIQRCPIRTSDQNDNIKRMVGRVGDRVFPGDVISLQVRMGNGAYPTMSFKQPFELPVVFEDDYFAIVNKPAGIVVYAHKQGGYGTMTIRSCLPFALTPPAVGTYSTLRRPQPVHRLDKPTSGLLLVAKTKPAMQDLCRQFAERIVKKTYTAIVNGIPFESKDGLLSKDAATIGVDVPIEVGENQIVWQLIDEPLEGKHATTLWRSKKFASSLKANENTLTMVELKPKTGRYHQLRRHMAWCCETPLVGDSDYDGGGNAMSLRERGLFLCSNRVVLEHPVYNTEQGRAIWDAMTVQKRKNSNNDNSMIFVDDRGVIMVHAEINLPEKFDSFLQREQERFERLHESS